MAEQGTHTSLLKSGGMYSRLVKRQLLGFDHSMSPTKDLSTSNVEQDALNLDPDKVMIKDGLSPNHRGSSCSYCTRKRNPDAGSSGIKIHGHTGDPIGIFHHSTACTCDGTVSPFGTPKLSATP